MKTKCPHCRQPIEVPEYNKMDYQKYGRTCKCPRTECGKKIYFQKNANNYIHDKNGTLKRKYKPKK